MNCRQLLPTAREGNVFTGVCHSVHNRPHAYSVTAHPCWLLGHLLRCGRYASYYNAFSLCNLKTNGFKKFGKKLFNVHLFDGEWTRTLFYISLFRSGRAFIRFKEADAVVKSIKALRHKLWRMSIPPNRCK